jgi:nicotinamide-nucleotide amidase
MAPFKVHPLVEQLVRSLRARKETVAFAESCTGALLSAMVTDLPGVSDVYLGSIVAYAYSAKETQLGVPRELLNSFGAVSLPVAKQMAHGVRRQLSSTWSVSITGIAGPGGGTDEKPVGTVCFGVCGPVVDSAEGVLLEKVDQQIFVGDRQAIRLASAEHALSLLLAEVAK